MSEPTTEEMIGWCDLILGRLASSIDNICQHGGHITQIEEIQDHVEMLGAIKDRLRRSTGKSEPPSPYEPRR